MEPFLVHTLPIYRIIKRSGLTEVEAGAILGIKQPTFGPHRSRLLLHKAARLTGVMEPSYAVREQGGAVLLRIFAESNLLAGVTADVA
jgi:hypothetical protein